MRMILARTIAGIVTMGVFSLLIFVSPADAQAQTTPERALSIGPLRTETQLAKGTSKTGTLTIYNAGKQDLTIQMSTQLFTVSDNDYNYLFKPDSPNNQWVRYNPANFELKAGQSKDIEYSVNVPITASPGDRYFSMFASTTPSNTDGKIATTERVASLYYLTVPGDITRSGKLLSIRSPLITGGDTTWSATIQNSGTALFRSNYSASVQTLWGQELTHSKSDSLILANSVRLVSDKLTMPAWLGVYNVAYTVELGDAPTATSTQLLIYLPLPQLILLIALIAVGVSPIISRIRRRHNTKKKIKKNPNSSEE